MKKLTPAQQQYADLKSQHKDALLFFRLGDFYELFYDDAKTAHEVLDITLTARHKESANPIPMAGVPHHSAEKYIQRLLKAGYKVAVAEQVGKVTPGQVVDRKVVEVLTPGTIIEENTQENILLGVLFQGIEKPYHLCWGDVGLGVRETDSVTTIEEVLEKIYILQAREVLIDVDMPEKQSLEAVVKENFDCVISTHGVPYDTTKLLQTCTGTSSLVGYGQALTGHREDVVALVMSYIETLQQQLPKITALRYHDTGQLVHFDAITRDNLEIFSSRYEGSTKHSLFAVMNTCKTAMGSRLLASYLNQPIRDKETLLQRQSYIATYQKDTSKHEILQEILKKIPDLPRLLTRIITKKISPQSVQQLMFTLEYILPEMVEELTVVGCEAKHLEDAHALSSTLSRALTDEPLRGHDYYIRSGYNTEVDELKHTALASDELLLSYQQDMQKHAGVGVKIKFIKNQGYVIEVTPKDVTTFEASTDMTQEKFAFIRSNTLKSGQRYTTQYLQVLQKNIDEASSVLVEKEHEILVGLIALVEEGHEALMYLAHYIAVLDLSLSMAIFADHHNRVRPDLHEDRDIEITVGRHPVVEAFLPTTQDFIPNDYTVTEETFFHLLTGPNMGGKSTYLRQNALIVLLSHAGLYVPAESARIGIVDGIFARVGAGDALAKNQSTFMTEMLEMANILHHSTNKSFIVLDELGRGTSTYDGMALAKAICVYMCQQKHSTTLFATHYHELTDLAVTLDACENISVGVHETATDVVFLKKIVPGKADKSYGIDVAKLAGIPTSVIGQAKTFLKDLEDEKKHEKKLKQPLTQPGFSFAGLDSQDQKTFEEIQQLCEHISIDEMTPIEGLLTLQNIVKRFK